MRAAEKDLAKLVKITLSDDEFDALVSFQFNVGLLGSSSLLRKLNAGDKTAAAEEFMKWVYDKEASPDPIADLVRRRKSERNLFLSKTPFIVQ